MMDNQIRDLKYKLLQLANCDETLQLLLGSFDDKEFSNLFHAFSLEFERRVLTTEETPISDGPIAHPW